MPKLDREGNILRPVKKESVPPDKQTQQENEIKPDENLEIAMIEDTDEDDAPTKKTVAIIYDFIIHCASVGPVGIDMVWVCENCPFKKTLCVDTTILPDKEQMQAIAKILMRENEESDVIPRQDSH